jgi:hypothetical protein
LSIGGILAIIVLIPTATFGLTLLVRRVFPGVTRLDPQPWSATLSYVAATFGVLLGFTIVFLLSEYSGARHAVGDEATSIGTAFEEARVFPDQAPAIQHALMCYSRAVTDYEWPALASRSSAPEADDAYRDVIVAMGGVDTITDGTSQSAAATNMFVQAGNISTARETRFVVAQSLVHGPLWGVFVFGAFVVLILLFVSSAQAHPLAQALLMSLASFVTVVMLAMVLNLGAPFRSGGGRLDPTLIRDTTALMQREAPAAASQPCSFDAGG